MWANAPGKKIKPKLMTDLWFILLTRDVMHLNIFKIKNNSLPDINPGNRFAVAQDFWSMKSLRLRLCIWGLAYPFYWQELRSFDARLILFP